MGIWEEISIEESIEMSEKNEDKKERAIYVYDLVNYWISNVDGKVGVACALFSLIFGVLTFIAESMIGKILLAIDFNENWLIPALVDSALILGVLFWVFSVCKCISAIIPNLGKSGIPQKKKKYPIFFGDISEIDLEEYKRLMIEGSTEDYFDEIIDETHFNSKIASAKMKKYRSGVRWFCRALVAISIGLIGRFIFAFFLD